MATATYAELWNSCRDLLRTIIASKSLSFGVQRLHFDLDDAVMDMVERILRADLLDDWDPATGSLDNFVAGYAHLTARAAVTTAVRHRDRHGGSIEYATEFWGVEFDPVEAVERLDLDELLEVLGDDWGPRRLTQQERRELLAWWERLGEAEDRDELGQLLAEQAEYFDRHPSVLREWRQRARERAREVGLLPAYAEAPKPVHEPVAPPAGWEWLREEWARSMTEA